MLPGTPPRISVIMVDGSFREHFHAIRYFGNQTLAPEEYELLWVEFYQDVKPELRAEIEKFPNFRIITLGNNATTVYHSSFCFNRGIVEAQADLLAIPDADVVVERDFLDRVGQEHLTNDKLVMYIYRYNVFENDHIPNWTLDHLRKVSRNSNPNNYGSCLTVRKKWLLQINGYDQHPIFETEMHGNGYDVYCRLKAFGLHIMWSPDIKIYHPWHPMTGVWHDNYEKQHVVSDWRSRALVSVAFHGIESERNWDLPLDLRKALDNIKKTSPSKKPSPSFRRFLLRVRHKFWMIR